MTKKQSKSITQNKPKRYRRKQLSHQIKQGIERSMPLNYDEMSEQAFFNLIDTAVAAKICGYEDHSSFASVLQRRVNSIEPVAQLINLRNLGTTALKNRKTGGSAGLIWRREDVLKVKAEMEFNKAVREARKVMTPDERQAYDTEQERLRRQRPEIRATDLKRNTTPKKRLYNLKKSCKSRDVFIDLTLEQYEEVCKPNICSYCKDQLGKLFGELGVGHGLDKLIPALGYTMGNVVLSCQPCNWIKGNNLTQEEALAAVKAVLKVRRKNKKQELLDSKGETRQ